MMRLDPIECWPAWKMIEAKRLHALRSTMLSLARHRWMHLEFDDEFVEFGSYLAESQ
jgi:hypothetical protein